jgi:phosphoenolpyruvate carboxykinase (GTP)
VDHRSIPDQKVGAERTPIGHLPRENDLEIGGSDVSLTDLALLLDVDPEEWMAEVGRSGKFLSNFSERLPRAIQSEHEALTRRLRVPGMAAWSEGGGS